MKRNLSIILCLALLVAAIFTLAACKSECEHEYTSAETTPATCSAEGVKTFTCVKEGCGHSYTEPIAPIPHTEEVVEAVPVTCTSDGAKAGKKCSVCGTVTLAGEVIKSSGHSYTNDKCVNCGEWDPDANLSVYLLDSAELDTFAKGTYNDGDTLNLGTNGFFTLITKGGEKGTCVEDRDDAVTFEDGEEYNRRISFGGKSSVKNGGTIMYPSVKITVDGAATVKIWWVCGKGSKTGRYMAICTADGTVIDECDPGVAETAYITTLEITEGGEYYISNMIDNNYLYRIEVVVPNAE